MSITRGPVSIVGAGPTGALLAILLQRRGYAVTLYDGRPDPRSSAVESGRSINLALADRGIHALEMTGVLEEVSGRWVPMRGRLVHQLDGSESLQLYGQRQSEVIYSISRHLLNQALLTLAVERHGVAAKFEHRLEDADFDAGSARIRDVRGDRVVHVPLQPLLAADGAGSTMRRCMSAARLIAATEAGLEHGYKELSIPAGPNGSHRMAHDVLHIWPRGNFMLIALPNTDGSFTATLFLANRGDESFATLMSPAAIERFLVTHFPDAVRLMPDCIAEFQANPTGFLGTVYTDPWSTGSAALIGDSAHAIVPFHGQGMNCCFEDCVELDACVERNSTWETAFADFYATRKPNTDAIAAMALENYFEMRERVADPRFRLQQTLALELERRHPQRFIPRYSMVMFHHEISYGTARERGALQTQLLSDLTAQTATLDDIDYVRAASEIERILPVLSRRSSVTKL